MKTYRQGDVLIIKLPDDVQVKRERAKRVPTDPDRGVVLAYGEVTGHAHALDPSVCTLFMAEPSVLTGETVNEMIGKLGGGRFQQGLPETDRFLEVKKPTALRHEEHAPVDLPEGVYVIRRQREYDPEFERMVAD